MKFLIIFFSFCATLSYADDDAICMNGFRLVNNKCWKAFSDPANHTVAERTCTSYGGTLFTAKNSIDNRAVLQMLNMGMEHLWIGLFCIGNDKSQCYWDDETGSAVSYDKFAIGFPNTGAGKCVYYSVSGNPSGQWLNGDCNLELSYVCELPPTHPDICDLNFNDNCYFPFDPLPFTQAQQQCKQLRGNLLSIHSADENRYIASIYSNTDYGSILIGGIATSKDNVVWTDGSIMDFNNIETFSSGSCLFMSLLTNDAHSRGAWFTGDCSTGSHFVCKRPIGVPNNRGTPAPITPAPPPITPPTCTTGVYMAPGMITSPNYPSFYTSASSCMYTLTTFGSNRICFTLGDFNTCGNTVIAIYDGDSTDAPLLTRFTSRPSQNSYTSNGNTMLINFVVDSGHAANFRGFNATFFSVF